MCPGPEDCSEPFNQRAGGIAQHLSSARSELTAQLLLLWLLIYTVSFWTQISVKLLWGHFHLFSSQEVACISEPLERSQVSESG